MSSIGIIGVGLLGSAIAARLWPRAIRSSGTISCPTAGSALPPRSRSPTECRTIIFCLPTSDVVAQVLAALKLARGTTIIDATTGEPDTMAAMGAKLAKDGVDYLDATVLGSSRVVRERRAVVMAGGRREVFDAAAPIFRTFASPIFYLGSVRRRRADEARRESRAGITPRRPRRDSRVRPGVRRVSHSTPWRC